MPISVVCPKCTKKLNAPDALAGKRAKCPQCTTVVVVPGIGVNAGVVPAPPVAPEPPPSPQTSIWDEDLDYRVPPLPKAAPSEEPARRPCPACGEMIPLQAAKCRFCDEVFDKALRRKEKKRKSRREYSDRDSDVSGLEVVGCILFSGLTFVWGFILLLQGKPKGRKVIAISFVAAIVWALIRFALEGVPPGRHLP